MTYASKIAERELDPIPELYEFEVGTGNFTRVTNYNRPVTFQGNEYTPAAISRKRFSQEEKLKNVQVEITAPILSPTAIYLGSVPTELVGVKIYRAFSTELTSFQQIFKGKIVKVSIKDLVVSATADSRNVLRHNKLPRFVHQPKCNFDLFDSDCTLLEEDFEVSATVTVSNSTLISSVFDGYDDGYFSMGFAKFGNDLRLITNHEGDTITLQVPFSSDLSTGGQVKAYPGCDKAHTTCKTKFDNLENFFGMPFIPSRNPVISGFD